MAISILKLKSNKKVLALTLAFAMYASMATAQIGLKDSLTLDTLKAFTSLAEALVHPDEVIKLDLKRERLKKFPPEIFKFTNLQYLDISKNQITEIPHEIGMLKNLQYLNTSKNNLKNLPYEIGALNNLLYLYIGQNDLSELPSTIGNLEKLKTIDAWSNNLSVFPDELSNLKQLKIFDLRSIIISDNEQKRIQKMLPTTKIHFSYHCACQN